MNVPAITLRDLAVAYDRRAAVSDVAGRFEPGSLTAVVGPNGAGKSSLLKAIVGVLRPASGSVDRGGLAGRDLGYLPQASELDRGFPLSVADAVLLGAFRRIGVLRGVDRATAHRARTALEAMGLDGFAARPVAALSAGQFQRVLFARLLLQDAPVILLDEPFAAIDAATTDALLTLVRRWHDEGRTVIAVLHDFDQVRAHFPETLLLAQRPVAWGRTDTVLAPENLRRARGLALRCDGDAALAAAAA